MANITLLQHWEHAVRLGTPSGALRATVNALGSSVFGPRHWREKLESLSTASGQVHIDGNTIVVPPATDPYVVALLRLDEYETAERYAVAKFLPRSLPVIELGAGIGVIACLTNRLLQHPSQHWVVEANPNLLSVLEQNREVNRAGFQVCHGAIAYGCAQLVPVEIDAAILETHVHDRSAASASVSAMTLSRLIERSEFAKLSLVCDIEGAEADLVEREADVLETHVESIVLEVHPDRLGNKAVEDMARRLSELQFVRVWENGDVWFLRKLP